MSKYSLEWDCGSDERLPEWLVCETLVSSNGSGVARIVFHSSCREESQTMLEEYQIAEQGAEYDLYVNQESEFDYV